MPPRFNDQQAQQYSEQISGALNDALNLQAHWRTRLALLSAERASAGGSLTTPQHQAQALAFIAHAWDETTTALVARLGDEAELDTKQSAAHKTYIEKAPPARQYSAESHKPQAKPPASEQHNADKERANT